MAVINLDIRSRQPYADGATFGDGGAYERLDGVIRFAVDPADPANAGIVDLDRAARDSGGRVQFEADFCLLQPVDPARGSRRLLFDVLNRGRKLVPRMFNRAPAELVPTENIHPGDGFLMRHGWSVAWCGWQWDVVRSPALMGLEAPQALGPDGQPIQGQVSVRFQTNERAADHLLCDRIHRPYAAADTEQADARLFVRDWHDGPATEIPRGQWRFARDESGAPVADETRVWLEGGFEPGRVYEVVYQTRVCPVVGTGLLAVRDCVAFLHHADAASGNPSAGRIDHTYAFGASQSGRFLRHFLYLGQNLDEAGRQVFDGINIHIAGARRGEFNHRYAQPSAQTIPSFGYLMPYTDDEQTDPLTERTGSLLARQRERGGVPRIFQTNTSAEYWRGDCSLIHTDLTGTRDVEPPAEDRIYLFAGTQHSAGALPLASVSAVDGARGVHSFNVVDYSPLSRAALTNLDAWAARGVEPPPSAFPRLADGTAVAAGEVLTTFAGFPNATLPNLERLPAVPAMRRYDLGPEAARGVGRFPAESGERYPVFVCAVNEDGNEAAGVRLPDLTVPVASYAGWNARHPETGGAGQILNMLGSSVPFPATAIEREGTGDRRLAITERYRDRDDYLARVREAATELATSRYLLEEDIDAVTQNCAARYDIFAPAPVAAGDSGAA